MSTTKPSRLSSFLTYCMIGCFGGCPVAFYEGEKLTGWGLLLTALLLRITLMVEAHIRTMQPKEKPEEPADFDADDPDDKYSSFSINLTTPDMERDFGWEHVDVYKKSPRYLQTVCFGGPPVYKELWEYEIKEDIFVFHRLVDSFIDDLWDPRYEVVNGVVQQRMIESRNAEPDTFVVAPPEQQLAALRQKVEWHEADGIVRYFILSKFRSYGWRNAITKMKESVEKIAVEAEKIGATMGENGWYQLPDDASEEQKQRLNELFSTKTLRNVYGFRSYREWVQRDRLIALLEPEPAQDTTEAVQ
jgi:hypothetical protein